MARCEDYPCCGHTAGDPCPDPRRGPACVECGGPLPRNTRSSICPRCLRAAEARFNLTGEMWPDEGDR